MSTSRAFDPIVAYACEDCGRAFVPPRLSVKAGFRGELRARRMALVGSGHAAAHRRLIVEADDQAYRLFAQTVHFCPQCRRFVCLVCWAAAYVTCKVCATRAMGNQFEPVRTSALGRLGAVRPALAAVPGRGGGLGRRVKRWAFAAVFVLLIIGGGMASAAAWSALGSSQVVAGATDVPAQLRVDTTTATSGTGYSSTGPPATGASPSARPSGKPTASGAPARRHGTVATDTP